VTDRKKPTAGFWITLALVALLVGYPLSFGPACWISSHAAHGERLLPVIYWPLLKFMSRKEQHKILSLPPVDDYVSTLSSSGLKDNSLSWYAEIGAREEAHWTYRVNYERKRGEPILIEREEWRWWP
jgi:hypothetical protein